MTHLLISPAIQTLAPFRLRRHADYQRVYKASRKYHSASMSYFFRLRSPEEQPPVIGPRVGLTVGKVMGKAVTRNRIKRRLREAVRLQMAVLHEADAAVRNLDLVLHPRKTSESIAFATLEREVARLFTQVVSMAAHPQPAPLPRSSPAQRSLPRQGKAMTASTARPRGDGPCIGRLEARS